MPKAIYIDESIHRRGDFILAALVYADDSIEAEVARILKDHGLRPGKDEYKSSSRHDQNPTLRLIRERFLELLQQVRLALVVCPYSDRPTLGGHILTGLGKIVASNGLEQEAITVYIDQGIQPGTPFDYQSIFQRLDLRWEQSSMTVLGIQVADCVAHVLSSMLLEQLGLISKTTNVGPNSGYDEDLEFSLGEELFAWVRRAFFTQDRVDLDAPHDYAFTLKVGPYGIFAAPTCDHILRRAVYDRFGTTFIGCMH